MIRCSIGYLVEASTASIILLASLEDQEQLWYRATEKRIERPGRLSNHMRSTRTEMLAIAIVMNETHLSGQATTRPPRHGVRRYLILVDRKLVLKLAGTVKEISSVNVLNKSSELCW